MTRFNRVVRKIKTDSHLQQPRRDVVSVGVRGARVRRLSCKRGRICSESVLCPCAELQANSKQVQALGVGVLEVEGKSFKLDQLVVSPKYQRPLDEDYWKGWR